MYLHWFAFLSERQHTGTATVGWWIRATPSLSVTYWSKVCACKASGSCCYLREEEEVNYDNITQYHALQNICKKPTNANLKSTHLLYFISQNSAFWDLNLCSAFHEKNKKGQAVVPCLQLTKVTNRCPLAPAMQGKSVKERSLRDNRAFVQFRVPAGVPSCTLSSNLPLTFVVMTFPLAFFFLTSFIWIDGQQQRHTDEWRSRLEQ